ARTLGDLPESLAEIVANPDRSLEDIPGIGHDLAEKIKTIVSTGTLPQVEELRSQVPAGVAGMRRIPRLGPEKAAALFTERSIVNLEMLKAAAESGEVAKLKGFGEKTAKTILEGLQHIAQSGARVYFAEAQPLAEAILADLRKVPGVHEAEV